MIIMPDDKDDNDVKGEDIEFYVFCLRHFGINNTIIAK
jgi:hypothetical protein